MAGIVERTATVAEQASATSVTGTLPTDLAVGDLVIAHFSMTCTPAQFTGPGGSWTQLVAPTDTGDSRTVAAYYLRDPGAAPTGSSSGAADGQTCICHGLAGVDGASPVDVAAQISTGTGTSIALTGVTTATAGAMVLTGVCAGTKSRTLTITPWTEIIQYSHSGAGRAGGIAGDIQASAGATGTATWGNTDTVSLTWAGYVVAFRPAHSPPPFVGRPMRVWRIR